MPASSPSAKPRRFGRAEAKRAVIILIILVLIAPLYWLALPSLQARFLPEAPGGQDGPWLVRPILAMRFGAATIMTAASLPFIIKPLRKVWVEKDAEAGRKYEPLRGRPWKAIGIGIKGTLLLGVYGMALVFYLLSWTLIEPDGIKQRLPWTTLNHSYDDIATLTTIPTGERVERLDYNGPYYSVRLASGRTITLSLSNEGITPKDLEAMSSFIAEQSGRDWEMWEGSEPR